MVCYFLRVTWANCVFPPGDSKLFFSKNTPFFVRRKFFFGKFCYLFGVKSWIQNKQKKIPVIVFLGDKRNYVSWKVELIPISIINTITFGIPIGHPVVPMTGHSTGNHKISSKCWRNCSLWNFLIFLIFSGFSFVLCSIVTRFIYKSQSPKNKNKTF